MSSDAHWRPPVRPGSRSSLFASLRRAMSLARVAIRPDSPPVDELVEMASESDRARASRRLFLGHAALAAAARKRLPVKPAPPAARRPPRRTPRIAVVGGGIAGLNATYTLQKAGLRATVYSAESRLGGRMS